MCVKKKKEYVPDFIEMSLPYFLFTLSQDVAFSNGLG